MIQGIYDIKFTGYWYPSQIHEYKISLWSIILLALTKSFSVMVETTRAMVQLYFVFSSWCQTHQMVSLCLKCFIEHKNEYKENNLCEHLLQLKESYVEQWTIKIEKLKQIHLDGKEVIKSRLGFRHF